MLLGAALVLPLLVFAVRRGWVTGTAASVAGVVVLLAMGSTRLPAGGVIDFESLERAGFLIALATSVWLLSRTRGGRGADPLRDRLVLLTVAAISVAVHLNLFAFHGLGVYVHNHDVGHYYLGSKYFPELGYGTLYPAIAQVERESSAQAGMVFRDAATGELALAGDAEEHGLTLKARFAPERWNAFRTDVAFFRGQLGSRWPAFTRDHGFNASPAWVAVGGTLARRVPATRRSILFLSLLDAMLLVAVFVLIAVWFGTNTMLLCLIHYCIIHGAGFGFTGGAFLRYLWLAAAIVSLCCLERGRHALAGIALAAATALAIFPIFFFVSRGVVIVARFLTGRGIVAGDRRFVLAFALALPAFLGAATSVVGTEAWRGFRDNLTAHVRTPSVNRVGFDVMAALGDGEATYAEAFRREQTVRRGASFPWKRGLAFVAVIALLAAGAGRMTAGESFAMGLPLVFVAAPLSSYYYSILVAWTLVFRDRPAWLLGAFALEAATGALALFEERSWVVYLYRCVMLASLYLAGLAAIVTRRRL